MSNKPTDDLSLAEAQFLMSQLIDGEIDPSDADRLHAYLEKNPDAMAWMESASLANFEKVQTHSEFESEAMRTSVLKEIEGASGNSSSRKDNDGSFLFFPVLFRALSAAAALAVVASITWFSLKDSSDPAIGQYADSSSIVEFVDTDLPDASPVVYTDSESGWTIVWIEQVPSDAG